MLEALNCMRKTTLCVLKFVGKLSSVFDTFTGIKQGASSSVILYIAFMDDTIDHLKEKCVSEPVLRNLHCLLHADDTLILSTNRKLFLNKCNNFTDLFDMKKMPVNIKKVWLVISL